VQLNQMLHVCTVPDGKQIRQVSLQPNSYPQTTCISPGARYLAYVDTNLYGTVHIWDVAGGHERRAITGDPSMSLYAERMLFSPDGRLLVSVASQRPVLIWEVFTGLVRLALPAATVSGQSTAAFSHNGRLLAVGSSTGEIRIIDMRSGAVAGPFLGHRGQLTGLAFSADGKQMISCSTDTTAVVWDVDKLLANLPRAQISAATARQMDGWWMGLASGDGRAASEAIWSLTDRPRETLALFREKLKPIVGPDAATVARWVSELDSPTFRVREKASNNLATMGESAREQLEAGLKSAPSAEARFRLTRLLSVINSQVSPAKLQPLRALEVLEKIGGPEAKAQLETLAKQSTDAEIRKEIDRVLERWK
jgi:WD40 domain-containing protein